MGEIRRRAVYEVVINYDTAATIRGDSPLNFRLSHSKVSADALKKSRIFIDNRARA
ncbi:MAG: hypothetical protein IJD59_01520 [Clostridia bacterium]|nr:hypothetical protein [Clostridia bacterium]